MAVALAIGACGTAVSPHPSPTLSPNPQPSPSLDPGEMPTIFAADVEPPELPPGDLVPGGADVTGEWFASTEEGALVLIAWVEPGSDYSRLPRGFAVWRRYGSTPHWRADLVERLDPEEGIQEIQISTGDVTGDRSDDALVFEGVGGSGACGSWLVIDLLRLEETYRRDVCDGRIDPRPPGSPGLVLTESVYREGDAHCCPSAVRATTLTWNGTAWRVTDRKTIEG